MGDKSTQAQQQADQPVREPMKAGKQILRNPTTDQRRVRRNMQKKAELNIVAVSFGPDDEDGVHKISVSYEGQDDPVVKAGSYAEAQEIALDAGLKNQWNDRTAGVTSWASRKQAGENPYPMGDDTMESWYEDEAKELANARADEAKIDANNDSFTIPFTAVLDDTPLIARMAKSASSHLAAGNDWLW